MILFPLLVPAVNCLSWIRLRRCELKPRVRVHASQRAYLRYYHAYMLYGRTDSTTICNFAALPLVARGQSHRASYTESPFIIRRSTEPSIVTPSGLVPLLNSHTLRRE